MTDGILDCVIVGAGFTGLSAALELAKSGKSVLVVEQEAGPGGLASDFLFSDGVRTEKFYHHWFNHDTEIQDLIEEIGLTKNVLKFESSTATYFNGRAWKMSSPLDLLKFKEISMIERIRLGFSVLYVRRIKNWKSIENLSIREWLEPIVGKNVYSKVWDPLVKAKFSVFSEEVSAVWMWKKLVLRGSTRKSNGAEELFYFKGGFGNLAEKIMDKVTIYGGKFLFDTSAISLKKSHSGTFEMLLKSGQSIMSKSVLFTTPLPITASIIPKDVGSFWLDSISRIPYLGNICLVLRLNQSLSKTYWLNVNDPGFPFVGVIEHTNLDNSDRYKGDSIVYLSRYISKSDAAWEYSESKYLEFALDHLEMMFPEFSQEWIVDFKIWKSEHAQPVALKNYSELIPSHQTPLPGIWIATMAQIYPEDRGTNYAVRDGKFVARRIKQSLEAN
ncbi:HemY Protoporphyrinogen oxidase [Candidatus Nanopelagicaceae bacterium]